MSSANTPDEIKKILLVDDDANFRKILRYLLFDMGLGVEEAKDGRTALESCLSADYALVLADANTPQLEILSFLSDIRARKPDLPMIVVSAFSSEEHRALAYRSGAIEFLEKPFDPDKFRRTIRRLVSLRAKKQSPVAPAGK
jgi:DNA-binding NtrC family response regulator